MKDMKDETKAACPIACPYCHAMGDSTVNA